MPTVVALTDASVPSLPRGWNAAVRIFEADGTTPATIYRDANGDDTGVNPLPQAKGSEFGIAGTGSWTVYVTAGTYVVSVTPHGGSAHTQTLVVATPAAADAGTELGTVWGTPSDGQVPLWNATAGRFEWGDAGGSASSSAVGSGRFFYDQPPTVVANNLVFSQTDSDPDIGTGIGYDPATGLFAVAAGLVHVRVELSFAADTTGNGFATLRARNAGDTGSVAVGDAAQCQTPVGLPAGQMLTLSDVLGVTEAGNVSVGWHQGTEAALDYCSVTVFTS